MVEIDLHLEQQNHVLSALTNDVNHEQFVEI